MYDCNKKLKKRTIDYFMVLVLVTFPFINMYATIIPSVGVSDFLLLLLLIYYCAKGLKNGIRETPISKYRIIVIGLILFNFLSVMMYTEMYMFKSIALRTARFIIYIAIGIFFSITPNLRQTAIKLFRFFSIVATLLLIVQNIWFKISGIYISGFLPIIPLMEENGVLQQIENIYVMGGRPFSFFSEPSSYGMYVGLCLAIEFFLSKSKDNFWIRWLFTFGLVLSGSTTGLASVIVIYVGYFWKKITCHDFYVNRKDMIFVVTLFPVFIYVLLTNPNVQLMFLRISQGNSMFDRVEGYKLFWSDMNFFETLIGHGMNDNIEDFFMSGYPRLYYYFGISGMIVVFIATYILYRKIDSLSRMVVCFVLFMNIATTWSLGQFCLLSYALIIPNFKDTAEKKHYYDEGNGKYE